MAQMKAFVDKLLTNVSSAYMPEGCIAEQVMPMIESAQFSGKLGKYGTNHLRIENTVVGGRGKFRRVETMARSTDAYQIEGHGLEGLVTKADYANFEKPFDAEKDETIGLTTLLLLEKEKGLADTLTNTSVITQNVTLSGTSQLSDYTNSDPIGVFKTARAAVMDGCGRAPNIAILDWKVADVLKYHAKLLDVLGYKYNRPDGLTEVELARALGVQKVYIPECRYESAKEGQTSSLAPVWGKHIVFAVAPSAAAPFQVSLGYRVQLAGQPARKVTKWDETNPSDSKAILVEDYYDMFLSNTAAGYLVKNAIA